MAVAANIHPGRLSEIGSYENAVYREDVATLIADANLLTLILVGFVGSPNVDAQSTWD